MKKNEKKKASKLCTARFFLHFHFLPSFFNWIFSGVHNFSSDCGWSLLVVSQKGFLREWDEIIWKILIITKLVKSPP